MLFAGQLAVMEDLHGPRPKVRNLGPYEEEYRFLPDRRFRFDFAWPSHKIAVEIEGGTYAGGRHVTGPGFAKDCEKYNLATLNGWSVYRFTTQMVKDGFAIDFMRKICQM